LLYLTLFLHFRKGLIKNWKILYGKPSVSKLRSINLS